MKGKNFSCNNISKKRKESDFYETPYSMTQQFINEEGRWNKNLPILEPARGNGAIVKVLAKSGFQKIESYDKEIDFLKETKQYPYIITNPPYSLAEEFILKAKKVALFKFAFLLPLSYLHGKRRYDLIYTDQQYSLTKVYVFTRYPLLGEPLREDGKYNTGMMVYAWFVWESLIDNQFPIIKWIDNNDFILSKKDK